MSRYRDLTQIIPNLHDEAFDQENRREEHYAIFGHLPPDDPNEKCQHPIHAAVRREMNGMALEVPFDPNEVISDDSELARQRQERYDMIYNATKQFQAQVEMEDRYENARKVGLILPDRIY